MHRTCTYTCKSKPTLNTNYGHTIYNKDTTRWGQFERFKISGCPPLALHDNALHLALPYVWLRDKGLVAPCFIVGNFYLFCCVHVHTYTSASVQLAFGIQRRGLRNYRSVPSVFEYFYPLSAAKDVRRVAVDQLNAHDKYVYFKQTVYLRGV